MGPFPWGNSYVIAKIHWRNLKIFSRTNQTLWFKGIQVCFKNGPLSFPSQDIYEIAKIHLGNLKIFLWRITLPISTKLCTKHPWVKGIYICSNEKPRPFSKGTKLRNSKKTLSKFQKSSSQKPLGQFQPNLTLSILGEGESRFYK